MESCAARRRWVLPGALEGWTQKWPVLRELEGQSVGPWVAPQLYESTGFPQEVQGKWGENDSESQINIKPSIFNKI
jgi:hypothetical protein